MDIAAKGFVLYYGLLRIKSIQDQDDKTIMGRNINDIYQTLHDRIPKTLCDIEVDDPTHGQRTIPIPGPLNTSQTHLFTSLTQKAPCKSSICWVMNGLCP